jgi:Response regulator of the LytR/AlgR family
MKIAVCEDEEYFANQIIKYINEWKNQSNISIEVFYFYNSEQFLSKWSESEDYDLIFIDINMDRISGIELAKIIRDTNSLVTLVFVTQLRDYVFQGYKVNAMQYLIKPIKKEDCFECLNLVYEQSQKINYLIIKESSKIIKIPIPNILYIEMHSHNAVITTLTDVYTTRQTVTQLLKIINDKYFIKCLKSYIINIRDVKSISKDACIMSNNKVIPINRATANDITGKFISYNEYKC